MSEHEHSTLRDAAVVHGRKLVISCLAGKTSSPTSLTDPAGARSLDSIGTPETVRRIIGANPQHGPVDVGF